VRLFGQQEIDPYRDDLYREVIRLRVATKAKLKTAAVAEKVRLGELEQAYKITANAGYGIFAQFNVSREDASVAVHALGEKPFRKRVAKVEDPGPYFHPLLATLITSAGRLMLTLAQVHVREVGLDWAFCDTDSLAIAQPDGMQDDEFLARVRTVVAWFVSLNPYGFEQSILKIEDENYSLDDEARLEPLYCWAISAKRYALYNLDANRGPIIRKASAHGLGHLAPPYGDKDGASGFPAPVAALCEGKSRVPRWQHDLWYAIISSALAGKPHSARFDYHPNLQLPAVSRYSATSPIIWRWFDRYNKGRPYSDKVKPFGFLYSLHPRKAKTRMRMSQGGPSARLPEVHPITLFEKDVAKSIAHAFDRETGQPISMDDLQTYAEALASYPNQPENKFLNGRPFGTGATEPRHIIATDIAFIGKEGERWEEGLFLGIDASEVLKFGPRPLHGSELYQDVRNAAKIYGRAAVARETGIPRSAVVKICTGVFVQVRARPAAVRSGLWRLERISAKLRAEQVSERRELSRVIEREGGIRAAARALGVDASNLSKRLKARPNL
jgi:hypothetical protein